MLDKISAKRHLAAIKHINPHGLAMFIRLGRIQKANQCENGFCLPVGRQGCGWSFLSDKHYNHTADGNVPNVNWNRDNRQANLDRNDPENSNSDNGVRGAKRDYALFKDFIQPPSILPISVSLLYVWKIFVSLAISISRKSRSFNTEISK
ncbi:hypothetical protein [Candidatus Hakubella thermalkaliphila]|uniref:hypothetical protein n=1 Tax=Candidatus Hakubella thermalkaliphila TaxID=2754717 RepID=UPI00159304F8|nr:hypothetical protein [Candidatus Hakubella thermalkaliphila]